MKRPELRLAIEINKRVRSDDEWFDEPDDLDRVESALRSIEDFDDPLTAAGAIAFRVTRAQGFTEGNKRTALLLARCVVRSDRCHGSASSAESSILMFFGDHNPPHFHVRYAGIKRGWPLTERFWPEIYLGEQQDWSWSGLSFTQTNSKSVGSEQ